MVSAIQVVMKKNRKKEEFGGYSDIIGSEEENGPKTKDILNNKTSMDINKAFMIMKELEMSENTIIRRQLRTDEYPSCKEGSCKEGSCKKCINRWRKSKFILNLMNKYFLKCFKDSQKADWELYNILIKTKQLSKIFYS